MTDRRIHFSKFYLDDSGFAELEKAGKVKLNPDLRAEVDTAISESIRHWEWLEAYSPDAIEARAEVADLGRKFLEALGKLSDAAYLSVILGDDEGEVELKNPRSIHCQLWAEAQSLYRVLNALITRAEKTAPYDLKRNSHAPRDLQIRVLCKSLKQIYERAGGKAKIGSHHGPFARFLGCVYAYLPDGFRPQSADAMVDQGRNALAELKKQAAKNSERKSQKSRAARRRYGQAQRLAYDLRYSNPGTPMSHRDIAAKISAAEFLDETGKKYKPDNYTPDDVKEMIDKLDQFLRRVKTSNRPFKYL